MAGRSNHRGIRRPLLVLGTALAIGFWLPGRIGVTTSASLSHRIFFLTAPNGRCKQGDYLLFTKELEGARGNRLLKMVGCGPGDRLTVRNDQYLCNGRLLGRRLNADSQGNPLPRFVFNGVVPAGRLFMIGDHPRSYDSRYFGFIDTGQVVSRACPLW